MTENTGAGEPQGGNSQAQPQGGTPPAQGASGQATQAQGAGQAAGGGDRGDSLEAKLERVMAENARFREERRQAAAAAEAEKPLADQLEQMKAELASERSQRQEQSLRAAAVTSATKLGYRNPDMAFRLLDIDAVEYAKDGSPANVEKLLTKVAENDPYLLASADFGGGNKGEPPAGSGNEMNDLIRSAAGR